jgi:hypothetical protein
MGCDFAVHEASECHSGRNPDGVEQPEIWSTQGWSEDGPTLGFGAQPRWGSSDGEHCL